MRAIFIDAKSKTVEEIDFVGNFRDIQKKLGVDCFTCVTVKADRRGPTETLYVDDNGLINGTKEFFFNPLFYPTPLAGNGLILGTTPGGSDRATKLDVDMVRASTRFASNP